MFKRVLCAAFALAILIPATGCGCRKSCFTSSSSYSPPCSCAPAGGPPPMPPPPPGALIPAVR